MEKLKLEIIKDLSLTKDKILESIVDVTELEIEKPKDEKSLQRMDSCFLQELSYDELESIIWEKEAMLEEKKYYYHER